MRMKIHDIISVVFVAAFCHIFAQQGSWITFNKDDGLADNEVYCMIQDNEGGYWFGTVKGLSRYNDGLWQTYTTENSGLLNDEIWALIQDREGTIWIGTYGGGVTLYKEGLWETFSLTDFIDIDKYYVTDIYESRDGTIWICTDNTGVCEYKNGEKTNIMADISGLADNSVRAAIEDHEGAMWFATAEGINQLNPDGSWETYNVLSSDFSTNNIWSVAETQAGAIWAGGDLVMSRLQDNQWNHYFPLNYGLGSYIWTVMCDHEGNVWMGSNDGAAYIKGTSLSVYHQANSGLCDNWVMKVYEDHTGNIWFCTRDGVSRYQKNIWVTYDSANSPISDNYIHNILEDYEGNMWFGTMNSGLVCYQKSGDWVYYNEENGSLPFNSILTIYEDHERTIWAGVSGWGVVRYEEGEWHNFNTFNSGIASNMVYAIYQDREGVIWFGTNTDQWGYGGLTKYKDGKWETYNTVNSDICHNEIFTITEDVHGNHWFGSNNNGVCKLSPDGSWVTMNTQNSPLESNFINRILEDSQHALWLGTWNGLTRYQDDEWYTFTISNSDLPSEFIFDIIEDNTGAIWVATGSGVARFKDNYWSIFRVDNSGIMENYVPCVFQDKQGDYWFGSNHSGATFYSGDYMPPFIVIKEKPQKIIGSSTPFFFYYGKDDQTENNEIRYSYAIVDSGVNPEQYYGPYSYDYYHYSNPLTSGTYTFYVRAQDKMGNISAPAQYTFCVDITPPVIIIESPKPHSTVGSIFSITGSIFDNSPIQDFYFYGVCCGMGESENEVSVWDTTGIFYTEIRNDTLCTIYTQGRQGTYQIKFFARDSLGHETKNVMTVYIVEASQQIIAKTGGYVRNASNTVALSLPPNSLSENTNVLICGVSRDNLDFQDLDTYRYSGIGYDILPRDLLLNKPAGLCLAYSDSNLIDVEDEKRLCICHYHDRAWRLVGGTVDRDVNTVTAGISVFGRYCIFENLSSNMSPDRYAGMQCQPRVFSPKGGGYDTQTAISFPLEKPSDVTVKVYNLSGRLKKCVAENRSMNEGVNVVRWNGRDENGAVAPSGLYIVTVQTDSKVMKKTVSVVNR
ncbi:T9SS type A sorting domain-containing protein [bacterium]|nr:T9SS type A sorting domain-containing protein [bacterium]